jgi:hypothetical protein
MTEEMKMKKKKREKWGWLLLHFVLVIFVNELTLLARR